MISSFRDVSLPLRRRLQADEHLHHVEWLGIRAVLRTAGFRNRRRHLGHRSKRRPDLARHRHRLRHRDSRRQIDVDPDRALVELRQELGPDLRRERPAAPTNAASATPITGFGASPTRQHRRVHALAAPHERVFPVRRRAPEQHVAQQRYKRQRDEERADERRRDGPRHRREDASLLALQREDRNVGDDDDEHREERRPADVGRRLEHRLAPIGRGDVGRAALEQPPIHVLDDDHRAVDDDPEVHGAE